MIIKHIPNILDKKNRLEVEYSGSSKSAEDILKDTLRVSTKGLVCVIGGRVVDWDHKPDIDDEVIFIQEINVIDWVAYAIYFMVMVAVSVTVSLIMQSMIKEPKAGSDSKTYSWDGIGNTIGEGNIVPIIYGKHRIGGIVLEAFTDGDNGEKYLNVLLGVSEGEIHNIDTSTIMIGNNDLTTFSEPGDITTWTRLGEIDQEPITGFSKSYRQYSLDNTVKLTNSGGGYIYKTNNACSEIKLEIMCQSLFQTNEEGDFNEMSVSFDIVAAPESNPTQWGNLVGKSSAGSSMLITAASKSPISIEKTFLLPNTEKYYIKVIRTTPDYASDLKKSSDSYLKTVVEIEPAQCAYPYTALLGLRIKATDKISGAMPSITLIATGRQLYDVRGYEISEYNSANPANIVYDLCTSERYGLGIYIKPTNIDIQSFIDFANWCDEIVEYSEFDHYLGHDVIKQQRRYEFNLVLDTEGKAEEVISKILNTCRSGLIWSGDTVRIVSEIRRTTIAQTFCMGNIIAGSYGETYANAKSIPQQVEVKILNEKNDYKAATIAVIDKNRLDEPKTPKTIDMYGITDLARAKREASYSMRKLKSVKRTISFGASIQAIICEPGDIIAFQHDIPQYGFGGTVLSSSGSLVVLDRIVPIVDGISHRLRIRLKDGSYLIHTELATSSTQTNMIDIGETIGQDISGCIWTFGEINKDFKPFRVQSIAKKSGFVFEITAEEYNDSIFNDDNSISIIDPQYSSLGLIATYKVDGSIPDPDLRIPTDMNLIPNQVTGSSNIPPFVYDVNLREELLLTGNIYKSTIVVDFASVSMSLNSLSKIVRYDVIYSIDNGLTWISDGSVTGIGFHRITNVVVGKTYHVNIKPITNYLTTNDIEWSSIALNHSIVPLGVTKNPSAISTLSTFGKNLAIVVTYDIPPDRDLDTIEVWASSINDRNAAVKISESRAGNITHSGISYGVTYYYWARARNTSGLFSAWYPSNANAGISGTASQDPADILSMLSGNITESQLTQDLIDRIDSSPDIDISLVETTLENMWTLKINEDNNIAGIGIVMYPMWDSASAYPIGDMVEASDGKFYRSIDAASINFDPSGGSNPSKWVEVPYGAKSEFTVLSDKFQIIRQDGVGGIRIPFVSGVVQGVDTVGINGALAVDGSISADAIKTNELIVGDNIMMGENAFISWGNVNGSDKPADNATSGNILNSDPQVLHPEYWNAPAIQFMTNIIGGISGKTALRGVPGDLNRFMELPDRKFATDRNKVYKISCLARKSQANTTGKLYLGLHHFDSNGDDLGYTISNYNRGEWNETQITIAFTRFSTIIIPSMFDNNVSFSVVHVSPGYTSTNGYMEVQDIRVEDITDAYNAQQVADVANAGIIALSSDSVLAPSEKIIALKEFTIISSEVTLLLNQAQGTTENSNLSAKFSALQTYIAPLLADMTISSAIVAETFRTKFKDYYDAKIMLIQKASDIAATKSTWSGVTGAGKPADYATYGGSFGLPFESWSLSNQTVVTISDGKVGDRALRLTGTGGYPSQPNFIPIDRSKVYKTRFWARPSVDNVSGSLYFCLKQYINETTLGALNSGRYPYQPGVSASQHRAEFGNDWHEYIGYWDSSAWQTDVKLVKPDFLNNYPNALGYWDIQDFTFEEVTDVKLALDTLGSIASDSILTKGEKPEVMKQWDIIGAEYLSIRDAAVALSITTVSYTAAYSALSSYLLSINYHITTIDSTIDPAIFRSKFASYYSEKAALQKLITDKAATTSSWSGVSGAGKPADYATSDIVLSGNGNCDIVGNKVIKSRGGNYAWDADAYSLESHTGGCYCQFRIDTVCWLMAGLTLDVPSGDGGIYTSIDYCWYTVGDGTLYIYRNGASTALGITYTPGDILAIKYDGSNVYFLKNGVLAYPAIPATTNLKFYFDSSLYNYGASISGIKFGPLTSNSWSDIGGTGKPSDNATVGADWNTNISNKPTIPVLPGYITSTKITSTTIESPTITGGVLQTNDTNIGVVRLSGNTLVVRDENGTIRVQIGNLT